ncbi:MAG: KH domain-containing protein [Candidatus Sumerlaeota bacterium]|nr:KH domain-containing protein [Candidatus Sumerlaeota bacterium]
MGGFTATGETYEAALEQALQRAKLPKEALEIHTVGGLGEKIDERHEREEDNTGVTLHVAIRPEHIAESARAALLRILGYMRVRVEVRTVVEGDVVCLKMRSQESALLIGRNGQTLEALQHMLNRMCGRPELGAPFIALDVENYRERRLARLERLARHGAREAVEGQKEVELEVMSPADRKVIHMTLRANPQVKTFSRGDEGDRRVVIAPA